MRNKYYMNLNGGLLSIFITGCLIALICTPPNVFAQDAVMYRVETGSGNVFIGELVSENESDVVLKTKELGEVTIPRDTIKSMEKIDPDRIRNGEYWFENPYPTRYFFGPNALGLKPGEGYYQNAWIFFNNVNFGLTKNFSMGGGTIPLFLMGIESFPFWLLPKFSLPIDSDRLHVGAGAMLGGIVGTESYALGLLYGVTTYGSADHNVTVGIGYGYSGDGLAKNPAINISGITRISRTVYLISENYIFSSYNDTNTLASFGMRWAPENFAVDFGLVRPLEGMEGLGIPWLGISLPF